MYVKNDRYLIETDEGYCHFRGMKKDTAHQTIDIAYTMGDVVGSIESTCDHKHYITKTDNIPADRVAVGDVLYGGANTQGEVKVTAVALKSGRVDVFDVVDVFPRRSFMVNGIKTSNCVYLDEFAFVENADEFYASTYPTISSSDKTKLIITSTPNGLNLFYKIFSEATRGLNAFKPYHIKWQEHPRRDPAINPQWEIDTRANIGAQRFRVEYDCEFLGSSRTLISGEALAKLTAQNPTRTEGDIYSEFEAPQEGRCYVLIVDSSNGVGLDYTVCNVIDITETPYKQVAIFRDDKTPPQAAAITVDRLSRRYNEALVVVENNHASGALILDTLWFSFENENILFTNVNRGEAVLDGQARKQQMGVTTTTKTKSKGCSRLKDLIEHNLLLINDTNTIDELMTFSLVNGRYQAERGKHDDTAMTLVLFAWLTGEDYFVDLYGVDVNKIVLKDLSEVNFFGFVDDYTGRSVNTSYLLPALSNRTELIK